MSVMVILAMDLMTAVTDMRSRVFENAELSLR